MSEEKGNAETEEVLPVKGLAPLNRFLNSNRAEKAVCVLLRFLIPLIFIYAHWKSVAAIYIFSSNIDLRFLSFGLNIIGGTISIDIMLWKRSTFKNFLKVFSNVRQMYNDEIKFRWYHRQLIVFIIPIFYEIASITLTIYVCIKHYWDFYDTWLVSNYFGAQVDTWNRETKHAVMVFEMCCYSFTIVCIGFHFQATFCYICLMHSAFLKALESRVRRTEEISREVVLSFRKQYDCYQESLTSFNDIIGNVIIIWVGISLVSNCTAIELILKTVDENSLLQVLFYIVLYMHSLIGLIAMTASCSGLPGRVSTVRSAAQSLTTRVQESPSHEVYAELQLFLWDLTSPPTGVVAGRCFLITAPFFLSYVGFAVTYAVLFIQFNPGILDKWQTPKSYCNISTH